LAGLRLAASLRLQLAKTFVSACSRVVSIFSFQGAALKSLSGLSYIINAQARLDVYVTFWVKTFCLCQLLLESRLRSGAF
jgi:hypothetical protein